MPSEEQRDLMMVSGWSMVSQLASLPSSISWACLAGTTTQGAQRQNLRCVRRSGPIPGPKPGPLIVMVGP